MRIKREKNCGKKFVSNRENCSMYYIEMFEIGIKIQILTAITN